MKRVLQEWLVFLEAKFGSKEHSASSVEKSKTICAEEQREVLEESLQGRLNGGDLVGKEPDCVEEDCTENKDETCESQTIHGNSTDLKGLLDGCFQVSPPCDLEPDVHKDLVELTTLCFELRVFSCGNGAAEESSDQSLPPAASWTFACRFIQNYFFLLDLKRLKQCIITMYSSSPNVWETYITGLKGN